MEIAFCTNCGSYNSYEERAEKSTIGVANGIEFGFAKVCAICSKCGKEVYVPEINDKNEKARNEAFAACRAYRNGKETQWYAIHNFRPEIGEKILVIDAMGCIFQTALLKSSDSIYPHFHNITVQDPPLLFWTPTPVDGWHDIKDSRPNAGEIVLVDDGITIWNARCISPSEPLDNEQRMLSPQYDSMPLLYPAICPIVKRWIEIPVLPDEKTKMLVESFTDTRKFKGVSRGANSQ